MKKYLLRATVFLAVFAFSLSAQTTAGSAAMTGVVQDASGSVIPGAKVVIDNAAKGIHRDLETNGAGVFNAPALVPADGYAVTISKTGFQSYELKNVELQVGQQLSLSPKLSVSGAATQVDITGEAPVVDSVKTEVSSNVGERQIMDLPINGRRVDSFVLLTPGVTNDASFGLLTFRGNPGGNSFLTDGVDTTNQFYDENAGRTRSYNISQDAVQEFQVVTSNFLAEYGRASGGVINTVTKSGSDAIHGSAYWFFRNRTLNATDPTANGLNPPEWRHQAGMSIGGPIKKDKLFYFFNGELQRRNAPIVNSHQNTLFDVNGNYIATGSSACGSPATPAQCQAAESYISSRVKNQLVPRTIDDNLLFGKIDYQINTNNRLTMEMNYLDFRSPNGIQTGASYTTGAGNGNNANTTVFDRTLKVGLTTVVSANAVNEARWGFFKDRQFDPASPSLMPPFGPAQLTVAGINYLGLATSYPRLLPSELRNQLSDSFSLTMGKHTMKFGMDYAHVEDYINYLSNQYGTFTYPSLTAFAEDFTGNTTGAKDWSSYSQTIGNPNLDLKLNELQFFAQDEFHVTPKLTVNYGVRYEVTFLPQPSQVNPAWPETGRIPQTRNNWGPRFGVAYSLNDKTVLRGGYGMFYNRYVTAGLESLFFSNGLYQPSYSLTGTNAAQLAAGPVFPTHLPAAPSVAGSASIDFADSNWRNSYSEQANFAIERQIAPNTSLSVSYVWSRSLHITSAYDGNAAAPTASYTYPILDAGGNQVSSYTTPIYTQRINPAYGKVIVMTSNANSYYNAMIVQLQKRYTKWFQAQVNYTWSHAIDDDIGGAAGGPAGSSGILYAPTYPTSVFNNNEGGEKGSAATDQRHRLVMNGIFNPVFVHGNSAIDRNLINGWQLSAVEVMGSSFPLPPTISVNTVPTAAMLGTSAGLLSTGSINGLGGATRVPFESISALNTAPIFRTDARISRIFPIKERIKIQLSFEATNVFNHFILSGAAARNSEQYFTEAYKGGVALAPYSLYGAAAQTQAPPDGTTARRAQAAVRISW